MQSNPIQIPASLSSHDSFDSGSEYSSGLSQMFAGTSAQRSRGLQGAGNPSDLGFAAKMSWFANVAKALAERDNMGVIHTCKLPVQPLEQDEGMGSPPTYLAYAYQLVAAHREALRAPSGEGPTSPRQNEHLVELIAPLKPEAAASRGLKTKEPSAASHALFESQTGLY